MNTIVILHSNIKKQQKNLQALTYKESEREKDKDAEEREYLLWDSHSWNGLS